MPLSKIVIPASLAVLLFAGCGGTEKTADTTADAGAKKGGVLTVPWSGDVDSIDPGVTYYSGGYMVANATQRTPMAYAPGKSEARPDLAVAAPAVSADGKTVTVQLKSGVKFSPPVAREVVADDLKYAIERGFFKTVNNPYAGSYFGDIVGAKVGAAAGTKIAGITTPDAHTVVFQLSRATGGTLAAALVLPLAAPVPRDYATPLDAEKVSEYGVKQVATGPYMVETYKPGTEITLVRNPSWDAKTDFRPAYLDRIEMPQGNDDATIAARRVLEGQSMVSGDWLLPPAVLKKAYENTPDQLELVDSGGGRWAALNTKVAPFDDVNVRKAVLASYDRQAALLALGGKAVGSVATHFLPPGTPGFEQAGGEAGTGVDFLASPTGDKAVAARYLQAAGFASGKYEGAEIMMVGPRDGNGKTISELAKGAFEAIGFKVNLRLLSQQVVMTKYCGNPAAAVAVCPNVGWVRDFADGQTYLDATFNGENIHPVGNANVSQLDDPAVNAAIDAAKTETDPAARAQKWGDVDRAITALAPAVPLTWDRVPMAHSKNVAAVANESLGVWDFGFTSLR
ncbi:ABC transporter substrate-binding protein [Solirubrobacter taibaiensis]|nr:ABC transporter substrate-binding protein [Solirubrobacter taibaiensis]